jgi:hypothetical protein
VRRRVKGSRRIGIGIALAASAAALSLAASAAPAGAVTVGQTGTPTDSFCTSPVDRLQPTVTSGPSYASPVDGTITSWSTQAGPNAGAEAKLKVYRLVAGNTYLAVAQDVPRPLVPNTLNTFVLSSNLGVGIGDLIGVNTSAGLPNCSFPVAGESYRRTVATSNIVNGESAAFDATVNSFRLNISAEIEPGSPPPPPPPPLPDDDGSPPPDNDFSFKVKKNKKKGTGKAKVMVPAPGEVELDQNKKVKGKQKTADEAGTVNLPIKPKGKAKKKLNKKGKAKVNVEITYTPSGDAPTTKSKSVKLKKKG